MELRADVEHFEPMDVCRATGKFGGGPLRPDVLAAAAPKIQKPMIGDKLYPRIKMIVGHENLAVRLTGITLLYENVDLLKALEDDQMLELMVHAALKTLTNLSLEEVVASTDSVVAELCTSSVERPPSGVSLEQSGAARVVTTTTDQRGVRREAGPPSRGGDQRRQRTEEMPPPAQPPHQGSRRRQYTEYWADDDEWGGGVYQEDWTGAQGGKGRKGKSRGKGRDKGQGKGRGDKGVGKKGKQPSRRELQWAGAHADLNWPYVPQHHAAAASSAARPRREAADDNAHYARQEYEAFRPDDQEDDAPEDVSAGRHERHRRITDRETGEDPAIAVMYDAHRRPPPQPADEDPHAFADDRIHRDTRDDDSARSRSSRGSQSRRGNEDYANGPRRRDAGGWQPRLPDSRRARSPERDDRIVRDEDRRRHRRDR